VTVGPEHAILRHMNHSDDPEAGERGPADPAVTAISSLIAAVPAGKSVTPEAVARVLAAERAKPSDPPDAWRRYLNPVKQQAIHLARQGQIAILRKGKPVDPHAPIKGVIRLAAAGPRASTSSA